MDFYRISVCAIQVRLEIHTKFVDRLNETHAKIQNAALELNAIK